MDYAALRRISLKTFIAFLILTALIAIVSVLIGEMGKIQPTFRTSHHEYLVNFQDRLS